MRMNSFRPPRPSDSATRGSGQKSQFAGAAAIFMRFTSFLFLVLLVVGAESFVVKVGKRDLHQRGIGTKQSYQIEEYCARTSLSSPILTCHGSNSQSKLYSSSSSAKDSELSSDTSTSNTTVSSLNSTTTVGSGSKIDERKRYGAELEEAFAQQTRERNPLLGVKSIGVDYGLVRTGVAVTIGYNPEALDVIVTDHPLLREDEAEGMLVADIEKEEEKRLEVQRARVTERVIELASRENADRIVVGLPLHKNGTEAPQSQLTRKFARNHLAIAALRNLGPGVSIYMCDERYTSKEAAARIRSNQPSRNNNDDLYGLLDAESAKIILEQYYDDHLDRYNTQSRNLSSDGEMKKVDPGYNGELVTISDPDLVEALTQEYNEKRRLERQRLTAERNEREARAKQRKLEMEKYRIQQ
eukprot:CAMPEP_0116119664 /NCGR_PEP_ID=MMETSP0329-20121206/2764_1 /TAXON_ID=697910 /ORGANISM="Pseudo-nitzschia arenysensis, Strain B593" /LENGTH=412 /DNA_ID=CAMNT_0003613385 /DNA_START=120 /DNA_END=1355 /DNA_ORIENTATION=-